MKLQQMTPNLMVNDVARSVMFYRDLLDFEVIASVPDSGPRNWVLLKGGGVHLMLQNRESLAEEMPLFAKMPTGGSFTLYFKVEGIQELYERVKGKAIIVLEMLISFYGMREFALRDPDGYVIVFAEPAKKE